MAATVDQKNLEASEAIRLYFECVSRFEPHLHLQFWFGETKIVMNISSSNTSFRVLLYAKRNTHPLEPAKTLGFRPITS